MHSRSFSVLLAKACNCAHAPQRRSAHPATSFPTKRVSHSPSATGSTVYSYSSTSAATRELSDAATTC